MVTVVGYAYRAEAVCPFCILGIVRRDFETTPGAATMTAEDLLDQVAAYVGIDRDDEETFDSDEFPKVIPDTTDLGAECGECGLPLTEDSA